MMLVDKLHKTKQDKKFKETGGTRQGLFLTLCGLYCIQGST